MVATSILCWELNFPPFLQDSDLSILHNSLVVCLCSWNSLLAIHFIKLFQNHLVDKVNIDLNVLDADFASHWKVFPP